MKIVLSGKFPKLIRVNFEAEIFTSHIVPNGHFHSWGKVVGHYFSGFFLFTMTLIDLDKESWGQLIVTTTLIGILSSLENKQTQTTFPYWAWASQGIWKIPMNRKLFICNEAVVETSCEAACMPGRVGTFKNLYWPGQVCLWNCFGPTRHRHILKREDTEENTELQKGCQEIFQRRKVEIILL